MLNRQQIRDLGLISDGFDEGSLRDAGYDLRVATLMGKVKQGMEIYSDDFDLEPQGIAAVISKEMLCLPKNVCAYASVKTALCREGVLAINIGVIDPGWNGPISSILLNFGKDAYRLKKEEHFLRLTFHELTSVEDLHQVAKTREVYETEIESKFNKRLAASFMDFDRAAANASKKYIEDLRGALLKYLPIAALLLAVLTFFINFGSISLASRTMPYDVVLLRAQALMEPIKKQTDDLRRENQDLKQQNEILRRQNEMVLQRVNLLGEQIRRLSNKK